MNTPSKNDCQIVSCQKTTINISTKRRIINIIQISPTTVAPMKTIKIQPFLL